MGGPWKGLDLISFAAEGPAALLPSLWVCGQAIVEYSHEISGVTFHLWVGKAFLEV
jgi:hypothetical protein